MLTTDRVAGGALAALALFVVWECRKLPLGSLSNPGPAYAPAALALVLLALAILVVANGGRAPAVASVGWGEARHALIILAACAFITWSLERLGYRLTMLAALSFLVGILERRNALLAIAFAAALAFGSFYLFDTLLRVQLPRGPFRL